MTWHLQAFEDVLEWQEPEAGGRAILAVGELSIMAHLPAADALPPPAPAESLDASGRPQLMRVPSGVGASDETPPPEAVHGAFHEVCCAPGTPTRGLHGFTFQRLITDSHLPITMIVPTVWLEGHAGWTCAASAKRCESCRWSQRTNVQAVYGSRKGGGCGRWTSTRP